ncbi:MAG: hypothetical protein MK116_10780 [Phycisphaerales bacterium]|nr:hypothetical protein [Phycisphaerales bacterium]
MTETTTNPENWTEHELRSTVAGSFRLRTMGMAIVCLVLGVWGVYDYIWAIPAEQEAYLRGEICRDVRSCVDEMSLGTQSTLPAETVEIIDLQLARDVSGNVSPEDLSWRDSLKIFRDAISPPPTLSPTDLPAVQEDALREADAGLDIYGDAEAPSKFDRPIQWLFILCLPFVPYYLWAFASANARRYRFEPNGTFEMPEGTWRADEIADIDMHRWMAKSICWLQHVDGTRVKLDAHIYKGLDTIIGAIAYRLRPEEWTVDARPLEKVRAEQAAMREAEEANTES